MTIAFDWDAKLQNKQANQQNIAAVSDRMLINMQTEPKLVKLFDNKAMIDSRNTVSSN